MILWTDHSITLALFTVLGSTAVVLLWFASMTKTLLKSTKTSGPYHAAYNAGTNYESNKQHSRSRQQRQNAPNPRLFTNLNGKENHPPKERGHSPRDIPILTQQGQDLTNTEKSCSEILQRFPPTSKGEADWIHQSKNTPREATSDTEDSLASSSSSGKMSRRQRKNKKKRNKTPSPNESPSLEFGTNVLFERLNISLPELHRLMLQDMCVDVETRILGGYPYATNNGTFVFKPRGYSHISVALSGHKLLEAEMDDLKNSSDSDTDSSEGAFPIYVGSKFSSNSTGRTKDKHINYYDNLPPLSMSLSSFRACTRCRRAFCVKNNGKEPCHYHPKKASIRQDGLLHHQCCDLVQDSIGCRKTTYHVYHQFSAGLNGPIQGFVSTEPKNRAPRVLGLDCEMVFTSHGFELAKVSLVTANGQSLLDTFVKPQGSIYDLNTEYSGIKEKNLRYAISFTSVQNKILDLVSRSDIIIGHSLESDLSVLKLIHRRVIDTSLLFNRTSSCNSKESKGGGSPIVHRQSLKSLVKLHLGKDIQRGSTGHSSVEDASFAVNLALWHLFEKMPKVGKYQKVAPVPTILQELS